MKFKRTLAAVVAAIAAGAFAQQQPHLDGAAEAGDSRARAILSRSDFDQASNVAEKRLGMSSLEAHDASHIAPFMPKPMQEIGEQMHRAASRFAVDAQNASVTNDVKPALASLATVMQQCVACHAAYRLH